MRVKIGITRQYGHYFAINLISIFLHHLRKTSDSSIVASATRREGLCSLQFCIYFKEMIRVSYAFLWPIIVHIFGTCICSGYEQRQRPVSLIYSTERKVLGRSFFWIQLGRISRDVKTPQSLLNTSIGLNSRLLALGSDANAYHLDF